jgi:hypothetical protein
MPTQEERLAAVEKFIETAQNFQRQAGAHIRETEENTTILLEIRRIVETLDQHTELLQQHTGLLRQILSRLPPIE